MIKLFSLKKQREEAEASGVVAGGRVSAAQLRATKGSTLCLFILSRSPFSLLLSLSLFSFLAILRLFHCPLSSLSLSVLRVSLMVFVPQSCLSTLARCLSAHAHSFYSFSLSFPIVLLTALYSIFLLSTSLAYLSLRCFLLPRVVFMFVPSADERVSYASLKEKKQSWSFPCSMFGAFFWSLCVSLSLSFIYVRGLTDRLIVYASD